MTSAESRVVGDDELCIAAEAVTLAELYRATALALSARACADTVTDEATAEREPRVDSGKSMD